MLKTESSQSSYTESEHNCINQSHPLLKINNVLIMDLSKRESHHHLVWSASTSSLWVHATGGQRYILPTRSVQGHTMCTWRRLYILSICAWSSDSSRGRRRTRTCDRPSGCWIASCCRHRTSHERRSRLVSTQFHLKETFKTLCNKSAIKWISIVDNILQTIQRTLTIAASKETSRSTTLPSISVHHKLLTNKSRTIAGNLLLTIGRHPGHCVFFLLHKFTEPISHIFYNVFGHFNINLWINYGCHWHPQCYIHGICIRRIWKTSTDNTSLWITHQPKTIKMKSWSSLYPKKAVSIILTYKNEKIWQQMLNRQIGSWSLFPPPQFLSSAIIN